MEARDEEKRKMVLGRRKKKESKERKIKKAENEIKSMRKNDGEDSHQEAKSFGNHFTRKELFRENHNFRDVILV